MDKKINREIENSELNEELNQENLDEVAGGKGELKKGSAALMSSLMLLSGAPGLSAYDNKARTGSMQTISADNSTPAKTGKLDGLKEKFKNILSKEKLQKIFTKENLKKYGIPAGMIGGGAVSAAALYKILMNNPKLIFSGDKSANPLIESIFEKYSDYSVADCMYIYSALLRTKDSNLELKKNLMPSGATELRHTIISFVGDNQELRKKTEKLLNLQAGKAFKLINRYEKYGDYQLSSLVNDMAELCTYYQPGANPQPFEYRKVLPSYLDCLEKFDLNMIEKPQEAEKIIKERHEANLGKIREENKYVPNENSDDNIEASKGGSEIILSQETFNIPVRRVEIKNVLKKYPTFTIAECAYIYYQLQHMDGEIVVLNRNQVARQANELCSKITALADDDIELRNNANKMMNLTAEEAYKIITSYENENDSLLHALIKRMSICYTGFQFDGFQSTCLDYIKELNLNEVNNPQPDDEREEESDGENNNEVAPEEDREEDDGSKIVFSKDRLRNKERYDIIKEILENYPDYKVDEYVYICSAILRAIEENPENPSLKLEKNLVPAGAEEVHDALVSNVLDPRLRKIADKVLSLKAEEASEMVKEEKNIRMDRIINTINFMAEFYNCPNKNIGKERDHYIYSLKYFKDPEEAENPEDEKVEEQKFEFSYDTFQENLYLVKPKDILKKYPDFTVVECAHIYNILSNSDEGSSVTLTRNQIAEGAESLRSTLDSILDRFNPQLKDKEHAVMDLKAEEAMNKYGNSQFYILVNIMASCGNNPESETYQNSYIKKLKEFELNEPNNTNFSEEYEEEKEKEKDSDYEAEEESDSEYENESDDESDGEAEDDYDNESEGESDDETDEESDEDSEWKIQREKIKNAIELAQQLIEDNKENGNTQLGELIADNIEKVLPGLGLTPDKFNNAVESICPQEFFEQTISSYQSEKIKEYQLKIYLGRIFQLLIREQSTQNE
ncbi:MAG: hypothetical protein Q4B93_02240 [Clostridia bacterium]|nr:hypothetical protein [Clostridia bacterium]